MLAIKLSDEIQKRLENLANLTGRTKTYYAREAITNSLDKMEEVYLAERELEYIRSGKVKIISSEAMWRDLGLDD